MFGLYHLVSPAGIEPATYRSKRYVMFRFTIGTFGASDRSRTCYEFPRRFRRPEPYPLDYRRISYSCMPLYHPNCLAVLRR